MIGRHDRSSLWAVFLRLDMGNHGRSLSSVTTVITVIFNNIITVIVNVCIVYG